MKRSSLSRHRRVRSAKPQLERLEDRLAPAVSVALIADPLAPGATALLVTGTEGNDIVWARPVPGAINIQSNGANLGNFAVPSGRIILDGLGGNDQLSAGANLAVPLWLKGGAGNDVLSGGAVADLLEGGDGADVLAGGQGQDLLLGGEGADSLFGATATTRDDVGDVLIPGTSALSGDGGTLFGFLSAWRARRSVAEMSSLIASVRDTVPAESLRGGFGPDLIIFGPGDNIVGVGPGETRIDLTRRATVTNVTSSTPDGTYSAGTTIDVEVTFSMPVTVTSSPTLTLETGEVDATATFLSGSGTNRLVFRYVVAAGQNSPDLDYTSALSLSGGTIRGVDADAITTLPFPGAPGSLGANKNIVIDTRPIVTAVSSPNANGTYRFGQVIDVVASFDQPVVVTGSPTLQLETGVTDRLATFVSGSGTANLTFRYTVQAGDATPDLDYTSANALALNGGTIRDVTGGSVAILTLPAPAAPGSLGANKALVVDARPIVTAVSSPTANGTYRAGQVIDLVVTYDQAVNVTGSPTLQLETGATDRLAAFVSGSGTSQLLFRYTVQPGDFSPDLDYTSANALSLNGGTIRDAVGTDEAVLTLPDPGGPGSLGANKNIVVDTRVRVTGVNSPTANGAYRAGQVIDVVVTFEQAVTVTGSPLLFLETGVTNRVATFIAGSGTSQLTFRYTVQAGDVTPDLDYTSADALSLNGGTIRAAIGPADAALTLPVPGSPGSLGANKDIAVDARVRVTGVSSPTPDGTYRTDQIIDVVVTYDQPVVVTGAPVLLLDTGTVDRLATFFAGSGTTQLTFRYTVQQGDTSADLDYTSADALSLNGGTIRDALGVADASLRLPVPGAPGSLSANKNIVVDTRVRVTGVNSPTANGAYRAGQVIDVVVTFEQAVTVTGTPVLFLETGTTDRPAAFVSGSGTANLTFRYTVQAGDTSPDLDYTSADALSLNGGTIRDALGFDASRTLPAPGTLGSLGANKALVIDTTPPTVNLSAPSVVTGGFMVSGSFSEAVTGFSSSDISITNGTVNALGTSGNFFSIIVTPAGPGPVIVTVVAGAVTDAAGNTNPASAITVSSRPGDLAALTNAFGIRIDGQAASNQAGFSVSNAGDVNGDGFADLIIGVNSTDNNGRSGSGSAYVIFGSAAPTGPLDLAALPAARGFRIDGADRFDTAGRSVSAAGDVNGDGFGDLIIGAPQTTSKGVNTGSAYVIFGSAAPTGPLDLAALPAARGFRIDGAAAGNRAGDSVSGAGDVNRDGLADLIIGAERADNNGRPDSGSAYVIFGSRTSPGNLDLAALPAARGFRVDGAVAGEGAGSSVSNAGDVNGDGFADLIVAAELAGNNGRFLSGSAYVIFGSAASPGNLDLAALPAARGFRVDGAAAGDLAGASVSNAGDVNGDGFADLILGALDADKNGRAFSGSGYVIFGSAAPTGPLDLAALPAARGFRIDGAAAGDTAGRSVSGAGDVNRDGFADLIIGAVGTDNNGRSASGSAYVIFGSAASGNLDLAALPAARGFLVDGAATNDLAGASVSNAGDVNGDGFADLILGAINADNNGRSDSGSTYVIFGADFRLVQLAV